jgi:hypothetical protein
MKSRVGNALPEWKWVIQNPDEVLSIKKNDNSKNVQCVGKPVETPRR